MPVTEKYLLGSIATLLSTELNSLANNGLAVMASPFNNTQGGGGGDGYPLCDLELVVTFGTGPTIGQISVWTLKAPDGTNYEDGADGTTTPTRQPDYVFGVANRTTAQRTVKPVWAPWGNARFLIKNDGTGQALAASGNTLKIVPATRQGV